MVDRKKVIEEIEKETCDICRHKVAPSKCCKCRKGVIKLALHKLDK